MSLEEEIKKVEDKIADAKENLGDVEVRDAIIEKAEIYLRHGKIEEVFYATRTFFIGCYRLRGGVYEVSRRRQKDGDPVLCAADLHGTAQPGENQDVLGPPEVPA